MDDVKSVEKQTWGVWTRPFMVMPEPTPQELETWAKVRALQKNDEAGRPVEGWAVRIDAMKADGRLWYNEDTKMWHRRSIEN